MKIVSTPVCLTLLMMFCPAWSYAGEINFKPPVRLVGGDGEYVNDDGEIMYVSPVLVDIDKDGEKELVIGDLWGHFYVYEKTDKPLVWKGPEKLAKEDGEELKLSNW